MSVANVNVVVIDGNLTQDPELRHLGSGTAVCTLRVAVNSRRKVGDEWVDKANYFNVTVWGKRAENAAQYLSKGRPVTVEGRLDWREWEAKDGSGKRQAVEIIANTVRYGPKPQGSGNTGSSETTTDNSPQEEMAPEVDDFQPAGAGSPSEDDIPF